MKSLKIRIVVAFAALYLIWGSTYLAIRFAIETLPPFFMAGIRFLIAGIILYLIARYKMGAAAPERRYWRPAFIIGGFLLLGGNGAVVWAEHFVPSGLAALLIAITPLWMVLLDWLWHQGKKPTMGVSLGILLGFLGVWLLVAPNFSSHAVHTIPLGGVCALLLASFSWAVGSIYSRKANLPKSPFIATGMEMMAGGILLLVFGLLQGEALACHVGHFSIKSILAFFYLIVFGSLIGFTAYIWLLGTVGTARASTYAFVNPVIAVFLGWAVGGETLTAQTMVAAAVIIIAVVVIMVYQREDELMLS